MRVPDKARGAGRRRKRRAGAGEGAGGGGRLSRGAHCCLHSPDSCQNENGNGVDSGVHRVAIIGAGLAGVGVAHALVRQLEEEACTAGKMHRRIQLVVFDESGRVAAGASGAAAGLLNASQNASGANASVRVAARNATLGLNASPLGLNASLAPNASP